MALLVLYKNCIFIVLYFIYLCFLIMNDGREEYRLKKNRNLKIKIVNIIKYMLIIHLQ